MRYCGVDVSAKPGNQQLVTLHERRAPAGGMELVATFYAPGTIEEVARTIQGFGRGEAVVAVDAPSGPRLGLLAAGSPLREELGLPEGRYERMRVCDALLFRRGLPLYPVPAAGTSPTGWEQWIGVGFELFAALGDLGLFRPDGTGPVAPVGGAALRFGRVCETYPDAIFCGLLGHRPSPKRTPWGLQQRIAALRLKGVEDADGGLWHRTLDELDACAAAYAAYALAAGLGLWVGVPEEGVSAPVGTAALRFGRVCETYPDAIFCGLLGHRPSPKRTPWGLQQRIAALRMKGVFDADGGLWHRTLDELDACAAAYAAYALAAGLGIWVGEPEEGVIVLPVAELRDRYEKLPPPARSALA